MIHAEWIKRQRRPAAVTGQNFKIKTLVIDFADENLIYLISKENYETSFNIKISKDRLTNLGDELNSKLSLM